MKAERERSKALERELRRKEAATLSARLERLGVTPSYSRPRVSDDNAYSEALFRTCKYGPNYPVHGFEHIDAARDWVLDFVH